MCWPTCRSLCVGIIFIAYAAQVKYKPFLDPNLDSANDVRAKATGVVLVYVRAGRKQTKNQPEKRLAGEGHRTATSLTDSER
jgi:hypothetical protein